MKFKPSRETGKLQGKLDVPKDSLAARLLPTVRLRKILVPIDFSDSSKKALAYAISFARQFTAELDLLYVVETPVPIPGIYDFPPPDIRAAQAARDKLLELSHELDQTVHVTAHTELGNPYEQIIRTAEARNCDLIILGTHGRTGLRRLLLGSTAERVLRHATCPVLVVRENERDFLSASELSPTVTLSSGKKPPKQK